jgi:hypothetical protein
VRRQDERHWIRVIGGHQKSRRAVLSTVIRVKRLVYMFRYVSWTNESFKWLHAGDFTPDFETTPRGNAIRTKIKEIDSVYSGNSKSILV